MELEHLSYSSLSLYLTCGRAWRYRYVEKIKTPTAPALAFGTAFHGAIETILRGNPAGSDPVGIWNESWAKAIDQEIAWNGELPEAMSNLGLRMLTCQDTTALLENLVPMLDSERKPILEHKVELRVPGVLLPIIGYIDLIDSTGMPCDFKTAGKMWTQEQAENELQPLYYIAALSQSGYVQDPERRFRHLVFTKTKNPQARVFESAHTPAQLLWLFWLIRQSWQGIERGVFLPNPGSWRCSLKWCEFWHFCRGRT